jgi:anthranilate phosphoribosyltransferase
MAILEGKKGPQRDVVVINAAAAIYVSGTAQDFREAISLAENSINSGQALQKLDELIAYSNRG